jgi:pyridoxine 5-phosphate synthase
VSLFIEAAPDQIAAAAAMGAQIVELHTGAYCDALREGHTDQAEALLQTLRDGADLAADLGLEIHAGHGIDYETVKAIASIRQVVELNIGHFLIGEAIFVGLGEAMAKMRGLMQEARAMS